MHAKPWHLSKLPSAALCAGAWATSSAHDSPGGFPCAVLRDAVVDRRPASARILSTQDTNAFRAVLYVTTHLSANLTASAAKATVANAPLDAAVEYAEHVSHIVIPRVPDGSRPGLITRYGHKVTEWQIGIRLQPREKGAVDAVAAAVASGALVNVTVPVVRFDQEKLPFRVGFPLRCAMGWDPVPGVAGRSAECRDGGEGASGAVLLSGSALYGEKKNDREHFREVANFAARGLMGELQFDAVAMSVVSDNFAADADLQCGKDAACREELDERNDRKLRDIAETVQEELWQIGVPKSLFSRVLLIPTCRLGSDATRTERDDSCKASNRYGQYHATFFSHAMLAPFYKWAVSYDMDEYLSKVPSPCHRQPEPGPAQTILDLADRSIGSTGGHMVSEWLNFRVASTFHSRKLSSDLIRGQSATLRDRKSGSESIDCHSRMKVLTGKSAVRCDIGLGFTTHRPVIPVTGKLMEQRQGLRLYSGLRTWHGRLGKSKGECELVPVD